MEREVIVTIYRRQPDGSKVELQLSGMAVTPEWSPEQVARALLDLEMAVNNSGGVRMHLETTGEEVRVTTRTEDEGADHARADAEEPTLPNFESSPSKCSKCGEGQEHENHDLHQPDSHIFIVRTVEVNE